MNSTRRNRILIAIALLVIVALVAVWILRNSIIRELSGPLLAQYGLEITDVSLDAVATANASIGYLELRHAGGTTIEIDDLELDVRKSAGGRRRYAAGRVTIALAESDDSDSDSIAGFIRQALALPGAVPLTDIAVGELRIAPYPAVQDLAWSTYAGRQTLDARVSDSAIGLDLARVADGRYRATIELESSAAPPQVLHAGIEDAANAIVLGTESSLDLDALEALAGRFVRLPDTLDIESADAAVSLRAEIPDAPAPAAKLTATVTPVSDWRFRFGDSTAVVAAFDGGFDVAANLPGVDWEVEAAGGTLSITHPSVTKAEVTFDDLACRSGIACAATVRASATGVDIAIGSAGFVETAAELRLETASGSVLQLIARPGATISANAIVAGKSRLSHVTANMVSTTNFELGDSGWQLSADSIDAGIDRLTAADAKANLSLFLEDAEVRSARGELGGRTGIYTPRVDLALDGAAAKLPGLRGDLHLQDRRMLADLATVGLDRDGRVEFAYGLETGAMALAMSGLAVDFAQEPLSARVELPVEDFDLAAGTLTIDARFEQPPRRPLGGSVDLGLSQAAGFYAGVAFTGAATNLELSYRPMTGVEAAPASGSVAFVDVGVPLRNIEADYHLHIGEESIDVSRLTLDAFGGTISAEPFSLGTDSEPDTVLVHVRSLDIAEMMTIREFEAVEVSGKVDADLPLTIGPDGITISDGRLTGIAPGGVIRYRAGAMAGDNSPMGIAAQALSNFEYESLTADVDYDEAGDLVVQMQLRGRNPDMDSSRPVVLNLGVENNIPQMLRSLQASRNAQDVLERRLNR